MPSPSFFGVIQTNSTNATMVFYAGDQRPVDKVSTDWARFGRPLHQRSLQNHGETSVWKRGFQVFGEMLREITDKKSFLGIAQASMICLSGPKQADPAQNAWGSRRNLKARHLPLLRSRYRALSFAEATSQMTVSGVRRHSSVWQRGTLTNGPGGIWRELVQAPYASTDKLLGSGGPPEASWEGWGPAACTQTKASEGEGSWGGNLRYDPGEFSSFKGHRSSRPNGRHRHFRAQ